MTEEQAFLQYEKMLHKLAWSFHNTTGLEVDDLFAEASIGLLLACKSYKPEKGTLTTWIWICVSMHLRQYIKKQKGPGWRLMLDEDIADPRNDIEAKENFEGLLDSMTKEAQMVVKIILDAPMEFFDIGSKFARGILFRKLKRLGWSWGVIWKIFAEIKSALNEPGA